MDYISNLFLFNSGSFSFLENRILNAVNHQLQPLLRVRFSKVRDSTFFVQKKDEEIIIPLRSILGENSNNYSRLYSSFRSIMSKQLEYYDKYSERYYISSVFSSVVVQRRRGSITVVVCAAYINIIYSFYAGFVGYDYEILSNIQCNNAMRIYLLFCRQERVFNFSIEKLKKIFSSSANYSNSDFIRRVISPSIDYINKNCLARVSFETLFDSGAIVAIRFSTSRVVYDSSIFGHLSSSVVTDAVLFRFLQEKFGFTRKELDSHKLLLSNLSKHGIEYSYLERLYHYFIKKDYSKGYVIVSLRKLIE